LRGGIPARDIAALDAYWQVMPGVRAQLFRPLRPGYAQLAVEPAALKGTILAHAEFAAFRDGVAALFARWRAATTPMLRAFDQGDPPRRLVETIAERLLRDFGAAPLLDVYDLYQHLLDFWAETMQDDCYLIAADGWVASPQMVREEVKSGKQKGQIKEKGWTCDLLPKPLIVARYYAPEQAALDALQAELDTVAAALSELEEEHGGEEGVFADFEKVNKGEVNRRLKELSPARDKAGGLTGPAVQSAGDAPGDGPDDAAVLRQWLALEQRQSELKQQIKEADAALDRLAYNHYARLSVDAIKTLVVEDKWLAALTAAVQGELERVSQTLTGRIRQLAERYAAPLPQMVAEVDELSARVEAHLARMGATWQ